MRPCPLFAAVLSGMGRRSRRSERMLGAMQAQLNRMETTMSNTKAELLAEIAQVKGAAVALLKSKDDAINEAVAKAKAAWDADNADEHAAAMAALEDVRKSLGESPFSPSGN